jgi:glycosyltransferase involved in cell wall biosynthesis
MKILYMTNARMPTEKAHGLQIMKTCESLAEKGVTVELVCPTRKNYLSENPFRFYGVRECFSITTLTSIDFLAWPIPKKIGFYLQSWSFMRAARAFQRKQSDTLIYTRDVMIAAAIPGVFFEIHSLPSHKTPTFKKALANSVGLVVISGGLKKALTDQGVPHDRILVARDAVDVSQFSIDLLQAEARKELKLPQDETIILYSGHLYEWKGAHTLARASKHLDREQVYFVGGTPEDVDAFSRAFDLPNIHIVGWQDHTRIPLWLRAADILVIANSAKTKIGSTYTSPLKLFEYMASGTPIVAADVPAIKEVVSSAHVSFFVPDDPESLARTIRLLSKDVDAKKRAAHAREDAKQYSWKHRADAIVEWIKIRFSASRRTNATSVSDTGK